VRLALSFPFALFEYLDTDIMTDNFRQVSDELVQVANKLHFRGWLMGTSGNLSAVITPDPLRLAITRSGVDKGELTHSDILLIDEDSRPVTGESGKPSDESSLHVAVVKTGSAGAVLHTHSIWSTTLSDLHYSEHGFAIEGFEMLKGLSGVKTHLHREWIPILENSQDMSELAQTVTQTLTSYPETHALVLHRHGLYTWGRDLKEATRHVEILEFLFEALVRTRMVNYGSSHNTFE
jgi:methylthioribulose-1-phosphate dehydratase